MYVLLRGFCGVSGWAMVALGVFFAVAGIGGLFLLSGVILQEFMNGIRIVNAWTPDGGGFLAFLFELPGNLALLLFHYPFAAFATLIFFPLVAVFLPLYAGFFESDWGPILFGWLPVISGLVLVAAGLIVREALPKKKPVKKPQTPSARARE